MDLLGRIVEGLDGTDESVVQSRVDLSGSQATDDEQSQISVLKADSYLVKKLELSSRRNPGDISVWSTLGLRVRNALSQKQVSNGGEIERYTQVLRPREDVSVGRADEACH